MSIDIQSLKKRKKKDFAAIVDGLEDQNKNYNAEDDDRFWKLTVDKTKTGSAKIRFLPNNPNDKGHELPWCKIFRHFFKNEENGRVYAENSLTTLGKEDPVSKYNRVLWKKGNKEQARLQKRNLSYYSNILVIDDPANPENNGKVFLFRYGKKTFEKIEESLKPTFADIAAVNPFDFFEGADFQIRAKKKDGYQNYDASSFGEPSKLGDDDEIVDVANQLYSLSELISPDKFKSYKELEEKLEEVMEGEEIKSIEKTKPSEEVESPQDSEEDVESESFSNDDDDEGDEETDWFKKIADEEDDD